MSNIEQISGLWWPTGIKPSATRHAFKHVKAADVPISLCARHRRVVQAGGNIGLWPLRFARDFENVETFEPESLVFSCLVRNVGSVKNIHAHNMAIGAAAGSVGMVRESLASHHVTSGSDVEVRTLDSFGFDDVDLIQLDVEGYEFKVLSGARETIKRSRPVIQLEMRSFAKRYGDSDEDIAALLKELNYRQAAELLGNDVIFVPAERPVPMTASLLWNVFLTHVRAVMPGKRDNIGA